MLERLKRLKYDVQFFLWERAEWYSYWLHELVEEKYRDAQMNYYLDPEKAE